MNPIIQTVLSFGVITSFAVPFTMACVNWLGKAGVKGTWQLVSSLLIGLLLGGGLGFVSLGMQVAVIPVGASILYGLGIGLSASGVYDSFKAASLKGSLEAAERLQEPLTKE